MRRFAVLLVIVNGMGCSDIKKKVEPLIYNGPLIELDSVETFYSDSAVVRVRLTAPKQLEFDNNDREFPDGIFLEFYEADGVLSGRLVADYCYYYHETDIWRVLRNVIVRDLNSGDQLNTEELFWEQKKETIYTSKFVRIETEGEILMGEGLQAKQDFSWWKIHHPKGTINLNEEDN
jgi:hypothetical protein